MTDISGAFLHSYITEDIPMLLEPTIVELIMKLEQKLYQKYIWHNKNGMPIQDVKLRQDIYGTLQAAYCFGKLLDKNQFM